MISIQIDIDQDQVHGALTDMGYNNGADLVEFVVGVVEFVGDPSIAEALIGRLNETYIYLQEAFGE